ncbi:MAG: HlyD family efflux transporter periplasmic adaptor subunit [Colwellia sp.]|nr:HlyD family efflux transporter periplasmic adaptor subunit [Colwellia sp.]
MQTIMDSIDSKNSEKKPLKFYVIIIIFLVMLFAWSANSFLLSPTHAEASISRDDIVIATVKLGDLIQDVRAPGNLIAKNRQWLSARVSAKVIKRVLEPGALVTPDSIILTLSSPELTQQYKRVQIDYKVAQAQLEALKEVHITEQQKKQADVMLLEIEKQQAVEDAAAKKQLRVTKIIPLYQYNEAVLREKKLTLKLEIAQFELTQLPRLQASLLNVEQAKVEQQWLQVSLLREQVALLDVRAQMHGILQSISVEAGQEISQGTELARVADQKSLKAQLRVQESQAKDIQLGQTVEIDTRRSKVSGVVSRIDPAVINGTVTVEVTLPKTLPSEVRPDLRVNGIIEIQRLNNVLLLDKPSHWQAGKTTYLFKLTNDSQAVKTKITIGANSAKSIQLLSGLQQGERVILSDTTHLQQYQAIVIY